MPSPTFTAVLEVHDLLVVQHPDVKSRSRGTVAAAPFPAAACPSSATTASLWGHAKPPTQPARLPLPPPHLLLLPSLSLITVLSSTPLATARINLLPPALLQTAPANRGAPLPQLVHEVGSEGRPV